MCVNKNKSCRLLSIIYYMILCHFILQDLVETVRDGLPDGSFDNMILMLKKFLGFMNLTVSNLGSFIGDLKRVDLKKIFYSRKGEGGVHLYKKFFS